MLLERFEIDDLLWADIEITGLQFVKTEDYRDGWDFDWEVVALYADDCLDEISLYTDKQEIAKELSERMINASKQIQKRLNEIEWEEM